VKDEDKRKLRLPSVLHGENHEVWRRILMHYVKVIGNYPVKVLDLTAGERRMWKSIDINASTLDGTKMMDVTFLDIRPFKYAIRCDYRKLPLKPNQYDIVVFDPPYTDVLGFDEVRRKVGDLRLKFSEIYNLKTGKLEKRDINIVSYEVSRVIKPNGYYIIKIQDLKDNWHYEFYERMSKMNLYDYIGVVIQVLPSTWHLYVSDETYYKPQNMHTYWMIWRRKT